MGKVGRITVLRCPKEQKLKVRLEKITEHIEKFVASRFGGIYIRLAIRSSNEKTTTGTQIVGMTGICRFLQEQV